MRPTLFTVPGLDLPVQAYGVFVAVGLIVGWLMSLAWARADKLPTDKLGNGYVLAVAAGLLGGRALFLAQRPEQFDGPLALLRLQAGGLAIGGAVILGVLATLLFVRKHGVPFWAWVDCAAPAFLLGVALERFGAFLAGTDFGRYVEPDFALGVRFPAGSPAEEFQRSVMQGMVFPEGTSFSVHPVQLYAVGMAGIGFAVLVWLRRRRSFTGQLAIAAFAWYTLARFVVEDMFRADARQHAFGPLSAGQGTAIAFSLLLVALWTSRRKAGKRDWEGGPWSPSEETSKDAGK